MKTLCVTSQKGGSGKTTLAINLAVAASAAGETVVLIDADPQNSASEWKRQRESADPLVTPATSDKLAGVLDLCRENGATLVIIDTPPHTPKADTEVRKAIEAADFCLIPSRAGLFDVKANATTAYTVKEAKRPAAFVLNAVPVQGKFADAAKVALAGYQLPVCPVTVYQRASIANSVLHGLTAPEFEPNGKAADEIARCWDWVKGQMQ